MGLSDSLGLSGAALGYMSDMRHNDELLTFLKDMINNFVAVGLLSSISGLRAFGVSRAIFYRESASGINRFAYYLALDIVGSVKTVLHCLCYLLPYYYFALPRAGFGSIYFVIVSLMFSWTGTAYITSQVCIAFNNSCPWYLGLVSFICYLVYFPIGTV